MYLYMHTLLSLISLPFLLSKFRSLLSPAVNSLLSPLHLSALLNLVVSLFCAPSSYFTLALCSPFLISSLFLFSHLFTPLMLNCSLSLLLFDFGFLLFCSAFISIPSPLSFPPLLSHSFLISTALLLL